MLRFAEEALSHPHRFRRVHRHALGQCARFFQELVVRRDLVHEPKLQCFFRADRIDTATKVYGVVGDPVEHSLSPQMMNAAFRRENLNCVYLPLHAKKIDDLIRCIREIPISGLSVTMPYKQEIIEGVETVYGSVAVDGYRVRTILTRPKGASGQLPGIFLVPWLSCDTSEIAVSSRAAVPWLLGAASPGLAQVPRSERASA